MSGTFPRRFPQRPIFIELVDFVNYLLDDAIHLEGVSRFPSIQQQSSRSSLLLSFDPAPDSVHGR
jgi:hypothetical protein